MNRILLESILQKMKTSLANGENIGDLKIGALYSIGSQLEAILYYVGHELGSLITDLPEEGSITEKLQTACERYHLGEFKLKEHNPEHLIFSLSQCQSSEKIADVKVKTDEMYCSFEAGLFAGLIEKITKKHCFAQEINCKVQGEVEACEFMVVISKE